MNADEASYRSDVAGEGATIVTYRRLRPFGDNGQVTNANAEFAGELGLDEAEARARLREENAHVAREAARLGPPSLACVSVPPRAP